MKGGIYTDEKCPVCGGNYRDNHVSGLVCPDHQKVRASSFTVRFDKVVKRFKSYDEAQRFLVGLRFKTDEMTFDERDYSAQKPLSFENAADRWLEYKVKEVRPNSFRAIKLHIGKAQKFYRDMNVKYIKYGDIEDFLVGLGPLSGKTRHNIASTLHNFFSWLAKRGEISSVPDFPVVNYEMGFRNTIDKETQMKILSKVADISDRKTYLGILWLTTYISVRPNEMINLTEGNIDLKNGYFYFPHPKEKKFKSVPIVNEDIEALRAFTLSPFPNTPFFRDGNGTKFNPRKFYTTWVKACKILGIEGVDLYGGTRHSSARALREFCTPEEIRRATMSASNKVFERYYKTEGSELRNVYGKTKQDKQASGVVVGFPVKNR